MKCFLLEKYKNRTQASSYFYLTPKRALECVLRWPLSIQFRFQLQILSLKNNHQNCFIEEIIKTNWLDDGANASLLTLTDVTHSFVSKKFLRLGNNFVWVVPRTSVCSSYPDVSECFNCCSYHPWCPLFCCLLYFLQVWNWLPIFPKVSYLFSCLEITERVDFWIKQ